LHLVGYILEYVLFFCLLAFSPEKIKVCSVGAIISFILSYTFTSYIIRYISNFAGHDQVIYILKPKGLDFIFFFAAYLFGVFKGVLPADDLHMSKHIVIRWVYDKMKITVVPIE
jgi:hypothetical protein